MNDSSRSLSVLFFLSPLQDASAPYITQRTYTAHCGCPTRSVINHSISHVTTLEKAFIAGSEPIIARIISSRG